MTSGQSGQRFLITEGVPSRLRFVVAILQKQGRQLFRSTLRSGAGGNWASEEFPMDSLNRSCLCRHTGLGETCAGEFFQAGILVSRRRLDSRIVGLCIQRYKSLGYV